MRANYPPRKSLSQPAAEEALRSFVAGGAEFDYGLARDLQFLISALRAAHDEAKAANQAKSAFLACVSHELRAPLNDIIGFAETIAGERPGAMPEQRTADHAKDIAKSARRLNDILGDIIDMARMEGGRLKPQRQTLVVSDLIEDVRAVLLERADPEAAPLEIRIAPEFPDTIWTDKARLRQILVNLLANALAYTPRDGVVSLSADLTAGGDAEIRIADTGPGMSPAEVKRAVTRFGHAEDESSRERPGIGLGLPLAKGLTELLGGQMTIASAPGHGTTVTLAFSMSALTMGTFRWGKPADRMAERAQRLLAQDDEREPG